MGVGKGVSVGTGVKVDMAKVGKGEGSITGAAGGATSDQLQANAARIKAESERIHPNLMVGFMYPPIEVRRIQAEYSTIAIPFPQYLQYNSGVTNKDIAR